MMWNRNCLVNIHEIQSLSHLKIYDDWLKINDNFLINDISNDGMICGLT